MANFLTGSFVEVMYTDNTVARFPEHIGQIGIVEHAPIHPSTWFTIKMMDGRSIKLQTTAMKHVAKNDSRSQMVHNNLLIPDQKSFVSGHPSVSGTPSSQLQLLRATVAYQSFSIYPDPFSTDAPKENHRPRSNSNVGISHFTKGVSVIILRTDNVLHRVPHLVGVVGTIKEVPVHPVTWFKIEFPSGQVATFRPSAFKLNDGKDEELPRPSKKPTAFSATFNQMYSKKSTKADKSSDYDYAVGMHVSIRSGELCGETGEVLKSSNGWIQVLTPLGRVAKRAHELEYSNNKTSTLTDSYQNSITREEADHLRMRPNHGLSNRCDQNGLKALKKAVFLSLHKDITTLCPKSSDNSPFKKRFSEPKYCASSSSGFTMAPLYDLERQSVDCPFPLIPLHLRQAKRKRIEEYVDSESEYRRPDLSFWLQEIKGSIQGSHSEHSDIYEAVSSPSPSSAASASTVSPTFPFPSSPELSPSQTSVPSEQVALSSSSSSSSSNAMSSASQIHVEVRENVSPSYAHTAMAIENNLSNTSTGVEMSRTEKSSAAAAALAYDESEVAYPYESSRDRSSSISETDCEESYSPEQTSLGERAEFSIPSPLSLPPQGTDCASHFLAMEESLKSKLIVNIIQDEILDGSLRISHPPPIEQRMESKSFTYANKPNFTSIPNPVKIFLPRHFSSQSCPTFSPFQTSTFSPFTIHSQKSPIVDGMSGRKHYIVTDKCPGVHPSPYVSSQHLSNFSL